MAGDVTRPPGFADGPTNNNNNSTLPVSGGALFSSPEGLTLVSSGLLLVADRGNGRLRLVDLNAGMVSTVIGPGEAARKENSALGGMVR